MKIIANNKRAGFDYEILDKWEAGLVLSGPEVKSAKAGHINLKSSYVTFHLNRLYLINAHIAPYSKAFSVQKGYNPLRSRQLLLRKEEIKKIAGKMGKAGSGLTLVPIHVYNKKGFLKIEFGLGRGRKKFDKREYVKKREDQKRIAQALRGRK